MDDLRALYTDLIRDHCESPRNRGSLEHHTGYAQGFNPLCGDRVRIELIVNDGVLEDIRFDGAGCAIATASASLMTQAVKGKPIDEVLHTFERVHTLVTADNDHEITDADTEGLGKLAALAGVRLIPIRVKCATLAWHALKAAIENDTQTVTTE